MNTTSTLHTAASAKESSGYPGLTFVRSLVRTDRSAAAAVLRLALAVAIFPHGAQKLLGWFGGYGFTGTMGFFTDTMGIPAVLALGVILIEFFAPLLLAVGAATRLAALGIGTVMATAMLMVNAQYGFFMNWSGQQQGEGIEYSLLALGIALALVVSGGGRWSVDRVLDRA